MQELDCLNLGLEQRLIRKVLVPEIISFALLYIFQMAEKNSVLVTGAAGFIGFHLSSRLCSLGYSVTGIDNLNDYYEVGLKHSRLNILKGLPDFSFHEIDLTDKKAIDNLFGENNVDELPANLKPLYRTLRRGTFNPFYNQLETMIFCFTDNNCSVEALLKRQ